MAPPREKLKALKSLEIGTREMGRQLILRIVRKFKPVCMVRVKFLVDDGSGATTTQWYVGKLTFIENPHEHELGNEYQYGMKIYFSADKTTELYMPAEMYQAIRNEDVVSMHKNK